MQSPYQRRRQAIAAGMERLERESLERAAKVTPARNLEVGLELSSLVMRSQTDFSKPLPPSLVEVWRKLHPAK